MDFGRMPGNEEKMMKLLFQEKRKETCFSLLRKGGMETRAGRGKKGFGGQADGTRLGKGSQKEFKK